MKSIKTLLLWCWLLAVPFGLETVVLTTAQAQKNLNDAVAALKNDPSNETKAQKVLEAYSYLNAPAIKAAANAKLQKELKKDIQQVEKIIVDAKAAALKAKGMKDADALAEAEVQEFIDNANFMLKLLKDDAAINAENDSDALQDYNSSLQEILKNLPSQKAKNKLLSQLNALEKRLNAQFGSVSARIANLTIPPFTPSAAPKISPADLQKVNDFDQRLGNALQQERQIESPIQDHQSEKFAFEFRNYQDFNSRVLKLQSDFDLITKFITPLPALLKESEQIVIIPGYSAVDQSRRDDIVRKLSRAQKIFDEGSVALLTIIKEQIKVVSYLTARIARTENLAGDTKIGNINLTALWNNLKTIITGDTAGQIFPKGTNIEQVKKLAENLEQSINRNIVNFENITGKVFKNLIQGQEIFVNYVDNFLGAGSLIDLLKPAPATPGIFQREREIKVSDTHDKGHLEHANKVIEASKRAIIDQTAKPPVFDYNLTELNAALGNIQQDALNSMEGKRAAVAIRKEVQDEIDRITALKPVAVKVTINGIEISKDMFKNDDSAAISKKLGELKDDHIRSVKNTIVEALQNRINTTIDQAQKYLIQAELDEIQKL
ncbi:MAG: hypothetical protein K2X90_03840 [Candidatus Babeliaceae bacterium]|nr:hypothetical protein [Candidatus Babeliaceae bacterium]